VVLVRESWCLASRGDPQTKTITKPTATPSPPVVDDPKQNVVDCYDSGQRATHQQLDNAIADFCEDVAQYAAWNDDQLITQDISFGHTFYQASTDAWISRINVVINFTIRKGCTWDIDRADCQRYLKVPVDSCNCGGIVENNCVVWKILIDVTRPLAINTKWIPRWWSIFRL
jgi:hypothetical protein